MGTETREFKTEIKQLLDLMIHSLYSHKEVFLRELISNASDAIDRARYESLTNAAVQESDKEWTIRIAADKEKGTLTVSDNGIGMTKEDAVEALGTIARSGTREFLQALRGKDVKDNPELIGQFGVGFYSSFMVADRITVFSRKAGSGGTAGVRWESTGDGSFTFEEVEKKGKGTDVILHLREDEKEYLEEWEIRDVVHRYSDFIEHPVVMEVERERPSELDKSKTVKLKEDVTLNSQKAVWLRDKSEIAPEDYNQFYKHISHDTEDPLKVIHYRAEGTSEFTGLLYIPSRPPFDIFWKDYKMGPMLYVKRVRIMEHCEELLPPNLRFVRGVVDSADLPLNISREMLQNNRQVEIIKGSITKKVLDTLAEMKKDEPEKYLAFYKQFGAVLKEGLYYDFARREAMADLLLFASTKAGIEAPRTLQEYVDGMKEGQESIYYMPATSFEEAVKSPYLEAFRAKDYRGAHHAGRGGQLRHARLLVQREAAQIDHSGRRRSRQVGERGKGEGAEEIQEADRPHQGGAGRRRQGRAPVGQAQGLRMPARGRRRRHQPADGEGPEGDGAERAGQQEDTRDQRRPPALCCDERPVREGQGKPRAAAVREATLRPGAPPGGVEAERPGCLRAGRGRPDGGGAEDGLKISGSHT